MIPDGVKRPQLQCRLNLSHAGQYVIGVQLAGWSKGDHGDICRSEDHASP